MSSVPISGQAYTFSLSLFSQATGDVVANPPPSVTPAGGRVVEFNLTSLEVGTAHFCIQCIDAAGAEWKSILYHETVGTASDFKADVSGIEASIGTVADLGSGSTLAFNMSDISGATFATSTDSLEAIRNRGDAAWTSAAQSVFGLTVLEAEIITQDFEGKIVQ